uniref:PDZ domain-containing protein n=1 Tax=Chlamydomonas leiostraca TaxID=1034604 RepID=A0A7S0WGV5_9CHLO
MATLQRLKAGPGSLDRAGAASARPMAGMTAPTTSPTMAAPVSARGRRAAAAAAVPAVRAAGCGARAARVVAARVTPDSVRDFDGGYGGGGGGGGRRQSSARAATASPASHPASHPQLEDLDADPSFAELSAEEQRTVRLFQASSASVVNVATTISAVSLLNPFNVSQVPRGVGSGFIWDNKGHVITNAHVIAGAPTADAAGSGGGGGGGYNGRGGAEVSVTLSDGRVAKAKVIGRSREKDIAVLRITSMTPQELASLRPVVLGSSSNLRVGQRVYAIGNPFGLDQTLTQGIVSGLGREVGGSGGGGGMLGGGAQGYPLITNAIQTDAAINPGNSGGPLLDSRGRVVGINTAILDPTGVGISSGVGFAIPMDPVVGMVAQILATGRVQRPALGVTLAPPQILQQLGVEGVLVLEVPAGSPAAQAGLRPTLRDPSSGALVLGDIITRMDSTRIRTYKDLLGVLDGKKPGDVVEMEVLRGGTKQMKLRVTLGERLLGQAE